MSKKVKTSKETPAPKGFKNVGDIHMDEKNTQALNVLTTQGDKEFVKHNKYRLKTFLFNFKRVLKQLNIKSKKNYHPYKCKCRFSSRFFESTCWI